MYVYVRESEKVAYSANGEATKTKKLINHKNRINKGENFMVELHSESALNFGIIHKCRKHAKKSKTQKAYSLS